MKTALEIGCGIKPIVLKNHEMVYLDYVKRKIPPKSRFVKHNLNILPLPFKNNSFNVIIAENVLEHLIPATTKEELWLKRFEEFYRILKPNGEIRIIVPHYTNGFILEHRVQFSIWNIKYIFEEENTWIKDMAKFNFKIKKLEIEMNTYWKFLENLINKHPKLMEIWEKYLCYIIRAKDIHFTLIKK